jgi:hypothetical protein
MTFVYKTIRRKARETEMEKQKINPVAQRMAERRQRWEIEQIAKILEEVLAGRMTREEARERL